jgi:DNA end-binding protein Ku
MAPPSLWSGNLRLSLVLIPVRLVPAVSTEEAISFRQIHEPSGKPIKYVKGVRDGDTFTEVPDEEIVKGYEHAKGHHVLIRPSEIDELKLEAKHTIDMARFVDEAEIDSRYYEKPYYLMPDGDEADEGYSVIRDALKQTRKVAIGQLIMHGREHLVGIKAMGHGLALYILRYADELRDPKSYFEDIAAEPDPKAVKLAAELIERESGRFEPEKMPDQYAVAVREMIQAKVENRAHEVVVAEGKPEAAVINIMDALKESMEAKGRAKVRDAPRRRMGKPPLEDEAKPTPARRRPSARPTLGTGR